MNNNWIVVVDLETGGLDRATCEITQIAACTIHPKTLEIGNTFNSECKPRDESNLDPKSLEITRKTVEQLREAPPLEEVWSNFRSYLKEFTGAGKYGKPIRAGYNILGFDNPILDRLSLEFKDVNKEGKPNLFSDFMSIDLMYTIWLLTENNHGLAKYSATGKHNITFETVCRWLGLSTDDLHDAETDVQQEAKAIVRFIKLYRTLWDRVKFAGSMKDE